MQRPPILWAFAAVCLAAPACIAVPPAETRHTLAAAIGSPPRGMGGEAAGDVEGVHSHRAALIPQSLFPEERSREWEGGVGYGFEMRLSGEDRTLRHIFFGTLRWIPIYERFEGSEVGWRLSFRIEPEFLLRPLGPAGVDAGGGVSLSTTIELGSFATGEGSCSSGNNGFACGAAWGEYGIGFSPEVAIRAVGAEAYFTVGASISFRFPAGAAFGIFIPTGT